MKHLFVDISSHGYGHLAQTAPLLNALSVNRPLRLTVRSGVTQAQLTRRIHAPFAHIHEASDFGFVMHNALNVDLEGSAQRYQAAYADWNAKVDTEARLLERLSPDLVLSNVSPLPLAGAAEAGIPAMAMCSLNWADLFHHYYAGQAWAQPVHAAMHGAYAGASDFLRFTPGMPMETLPNLRIIGPVSVYAKEVPRMSREEVAQALGLPLNKRWLLVALGGIAHRLPVERWPVLPDTQLVVPADWQVEPRSDITAYSDSQVAFTDLFPTVDIVLGKPGYGTFVEAACYGLPVLYLQRPNWPEAAYLEEWLHAHTRAAILATEAGQNGELGDAIAAVLSQAAPTRPTTDGAEAALRLINARLDTDATIAR